MTHPMRRLSDKIIAAHKQACDENRAEVAELLLQALQVDASYVGGKVRERRGDVDDLEEAFVRHHEFMERIRQTG